MNQQQIEQQMVQAEQALSFAYAAEESVYFLILQNYLETEEDQYDFFVNLADAQIQPKAHVEGRVYFRSNGDMMRAVRVLEGMGVL